MATFAWGQEDFLAKQYFADGDFEKAVVFYEKLVEKNPRRISKRTFKRPKPLSYFIGRFRI